jgi:GT2 family glycosyltransferase
MSPAESPKLAVVIPSRRGPRLAFALEALAAQTLPTESFEVIVVRDPRSAGPDPIAPGGLRVRFIAAPEACGPTVKRNIGWREADADLVAFTDDDCRPTSVWLERLAAEWGGVAERFVQGPTAPDPDEAHLLHGLARSVRVDADSPWFETCNLAYPRALLERLGGFDEEYEFGCEDTDLGVRATAIGAERAWAPEALVFHGVIPRSPLRAAREARRWPSHATVLLAALGLLLAGRRPLLGLAAIAPYVDTKLDRSVLGARGIARQLAGMPSQALVDLMETASTARAAVRYRTPVA